MILESWLQVRFSEMFSIIETKMNLDVLPGHVTIHYFEQPFDFGGDLHGDLHGDLRGDLRGDLGMRDPVLWVNG